MDHRHRESPIRRRYKSGEIVWVARYTALDGRRRIAKPAWKVEAELERISVIAYCLITRRLLDT
jgi:hypothetical protein